MKKTDKNLLLLQSLFITCVVVSPVVSSKLISLGFSIHSVAALIPGSAMIYAVIFLISNIISEMWGSKQSTSISICGFVCQIVSSCLFMLVQVLPANDVDVQNAYRMILGSNIVFTLSGIFTYILSQSSNILLYNALKKNPAVANLISTSISHLVDTVFFIGLSYGVCLGGFFEANTRIQILVMILCQYAVRILLTVVETPIFKLLVRKSKLKV